MKRIRLPQVNWRYALGELAIVVMGILIALWLNGWWGERIERREEHRALLRLQDAFRADRTQLLSVIEHHERQRSSTQALLRTMEPGAPPITPTEVTAHFNWALVSWTFNPSDGVLQDLLNSGRLHLITNDQLRSKLAAWPGQVADLAEDEAANRMILDEQLLPFLMRTVPLKLLPHYATATGEEPVSRFRWAPDQLLTSLEFENHLVNRLTVVTLDVLAEAKPLLAELDEILRLIQRELARKPRKVNQQ